MSEIKKIYKIVEMLNATTGQSGATRDQLECIINKKSLAYKILKSDPPEYSEKQLWVITFEAARNPRIYDLI